jgi:hypothetical protein
VPCHTCGAVSNPFVLNAGPLVGASRTEPLSPLGTLLCLPFAIYSPQYANQLISNIEHTREQY